MFSRLGPPPGERLREEFMKPLGLTQAELAATLGMPAAIAELHLS